MSDDLFKKSEYAAEMANKIANQALLLGNLFVSDEEVRDIEVAIYRALNAATVRRDHEQK